MSGFFLMAKKGSGGGAEAIPLIVICSSQFAGTTITATDGTHTLTEICPSASPYEITFTLPNDGAWTISGTASGRTFSTVVTIVPYETNLEAVPEGATALPTDDIQTWLHCAEIFDKSYTTLSEVLNDTTTLLALISSNNANDYLVRSTTWAADICSDSNAMAYIGANDYIAFKLMGDAVWVEAIGTSSYYQLVLDTKIPTMTGSTSPSGEASASSTTSGSPYKAFDGRTRQSAGGSYWDTTNYTNAWLRYHFNVPVCVVKFDFNTWNGESTQVETTVHIQGSNDGISFVDVNDFTSPKTGVNGVSGNFANSTKYSYYQFKFDGANYISTALHAFVDEAQLYGRA